MADQTVSRRKKPTAAAQAGRWVAAGGAVGASLAMIGVMAAAAQNGATSAGNEPVKRVVVLPEQTEATDQIVVVLPEAANPAAAPVVQQAPATAAPARPTPAPQPATQVRPSPVTESHGS